MEYFEEIYYACEKILSDLEDLLVPPVLLFDTDEYNDVYCF